MPKFIVIKRYKYESPSGWEWSETVTYHDGYEDAMDWYTNSYRIDNNMEIKDKDMKEKMVCVPIERENNNA